MNLNCQKIIANLAKIAGLIEEIRTDYGRFSQNYYDYIQPFAQRENEAWEGVLCATIDAIGDLESQLERLAAEEEAEAS